MTQNKDKYIKKLEEQNEQLRQELAEAEDLSEQAVFRKYKIERRKRNRRKNDSWRCIERLWTSRCVMCGRDVEAGCPPWDDDPQMVNAILKDAGTITISFGYGSNHDTEHYVGNFCDKCLPKFIRSLKVPITALAGAWGNSGQRLCEIRPYLKKIKPGRIIEDPLNP